MLIDIEYGLRLGLTPKELGVDLGEAPQLTQVDVAELTSDCTDSATTYQADYFDIEPTRDLENIPHELRYLGKDWWVELGECNKVDNFEIFTPERGNSHAGRLAKKVCEVCEVRPECVRSRVLESKSIPGGIVGGMNSKEQYLARRRWRTMQQDAKTELY